MYWTPGPDNSNLINTEKAVPNNPLNNANIRYKVPISFALLDKNQRSHHMEIFASLPFKPPSIYKDSEFIDLLSDTHAANILLCDTSGWLNRWANSESLSPETIH